jgi:hypothetical protein
MKATAGGGDPIWAPLTCLRTLASRLSVSTHLRSGSPKRFAESRRRSGFAENFDALTGADLRDRAYTGTASVYLLLKIPAGSLRNTWAASNRFDSQVRIQAWMHLWEISQFKGNSRHSDRIMRVGPSATDRVLFVQDRRRAIAIGGDSGVDSLEPVRLWPGRHALGQRRDQWR